MHGLGASLRQILRFARPWERIALGVVIFVVATSLGSYVLAALGVVIVGVTVLGLVRARRGVTGVSEADTESEAGSGSGAGSEAGGKP